MTFSFYAGADCSKKTIDFVVFDGQAFSHQMKVSNNIDAICEYFNNLEDLDMGDLALCMEHTGVYGENLIAACISLGIAIYIEGGYQIKHSLGLMRGKSDALDAKRIAEYAFRFNDKLHFYTPERQVIKELKLLRACRIRLIKSKNLLLVPINELKPFSSPESVQMLQHSVYKTIAAIDQDIKDIETKIKNIIDQDDNLKKLRKLITSVPNVGDVTATELIIKTNEFKKFDSAKKLACFSGVVPFEYSSGSSIRGRVRISHRADKTLKTLLHLCAMSAINSKGELFEYYTKKVNQGKNKMCVVNAVRNKILKRVFAVVKNQTMYQKKFKLYLA